MSNMNTKDLAKFDPNVADLEAMVEQTKNLTVTNLEDKKQIEAVKGGRIVLKKARVQIEKIGKGLRADAVKFQKDVIAKEKELIAIIAPEEERLAAIEDEAKKLAVRKERFLALPAKQERIKEAGLSDFFHLSNDEVVEMDDAAFEAHFQQMLGQKNERDAEAQRIKQAELDAKEKELDDERKRLNHEKEVAAAAEQARIETEARLKREAEEKAAQEAADAKFIKDALIAEQKKTERRKVFVNWLKSHGYTKETRGEFMISPSGDGYILYKKLGFFKK